MYVTLVHIHVKPEHIDEFAAACGANHRKSIKEPGNMRFDVLQLAEDPSRFILYEAYESQEHAAAHKDTPQYARWRETVESWMAEPRKGVVYEGVWPA